MSLTSNVPGDLPVREASFANEGPSDTPLSTFEGESIEDTKNSDRVVIAASIKQRLADILKGMMETKSGWVFSAPVDPVALAILDYFTVIRHPMNLGTISLKLNSGVYKFVDEFANDVRLTFSNAIAYNDQDQDLYTLAINMLSDFRARSTDWLAKFAFEPS